VPALKLERAHGPASREVLKGLRAFNVGVLGKLDHQPLTVTLNDKGRIVGGVIGETFIGWLFVKFLWVAETHRGTGWGKSLMEAAEKEARRRGVCNAYVDTFSFQAPEFYRKLGYREFGRLDDFPPGHSRSWLTKAL
jgi:ribosomal protein S18 acetylase RimI-like enzyme